MSFTIQWRSPEFHFMGKYNEYFRIGEHRRCIWGRLIVVFSEVSLALSKSKWRDYSNLFQKQWRPMEWIFPFLSWSQRRKKNFISRHDNLTVIVLWVNNMTRLPITDMMISTSWQLMLVRKGSTSSRIIILSKLSSSLSMQASALRRIYIK